MRTGTAYLMGAGIMTGTVMPRYGAGLEGDGHGA